MPINKLSNAPSARTFADAVADEVIKPAAEKAAGPDGVLDDVPADLNGADALAKTSFEMRADLTGSAAPDVQTFVTAVIHWTPPGPMTPWLPMIRTEVAARVMGAVRLGARRRSRPRRTCH